MLEVTLAVRGLIARLHDRKVDETTQEILDEMLVRSVEDLAQEVLEEKVERTVEDLALEVVEMEAEEIPLAPQFTKLTNVLLEGYTINRDLFTQAFTFNRYAPVESCTAYYETHNFKPRVEVRSRKTQTMSFKEVANYMVNQKMKTSDENSFMWMSSLANFESPEEKERFQTWKMMTPGSQLMSFIAYQVGISLADYSNGTSLQSFHSLEGA